MQQHPWDRQMGHWSQHCPCSAPQQWWLQATPGLQTWLSPAPARSWAQPENLPLLFTFAVAGRGVLWDELHQSLCASISLQPESSIRPSTTRGNRWQSCPPADHKSSYSEDTVHITPKQEILIHSPPLKHSECWLEKGHTPAGKCCVHMSGAEHVNTYEGSLLPLLNCTEISLHCFHF